MTETSGPSIPTNEEEATASLLRIAGPRTGIPADRAARLRHAVHEHWRATNRRRVFRRRIFVSALILATVTTVAMVVIGIRKPDAALVSIPNQTVARVERSRGQARLLAIRRDGPTVAPLVEDTLIRSGDSIETDANARAALRLTNGTSVRVDVSSRARLHSPTMIELSSGALYVDTGPNASGLEVRTPLGTAHDIGTQFEVRIQAASLQLRVRAGIVELRRGDQAIQARMGTELTMTSDGAASRAVSAYGAEWEWAVSLAPDFHIEGRPLSVFLSDLSREYGWGLRYADTTLAADASKIVLHGSVEGLQPQEALSVVLTTSDLAHRFRAGELLVFRATRQQ